MVFANPTYLYLLLLLIPMIGWYVYKLRKSQASLQVSSTEAFEVAGATSWKVYLRHVPFALRTLAIALLIVVLARPQSTDSWQNSTTEGIDIVMAMDISTSMLAEDLKPNRLEAAKDVAASFINGRQNDNIGLVVFAAESFTQCPLTIDHGVLLNLFKDIQPGIIQDGTAIGLGLANAVSRIKDSQAKSGYKTAFNPKAPTLRSEVATILANATENSLIILDEIGRGTSTFDGLAIAWSVVEHLSKVLPAKTLFATHYHELTELEGNLQGVKNYKILVKETDDDVIFLRKIVRGGANKSFGIEVARMAGVPKDVLQRAKQISKGLEKLNTKLDIDVLENSVKEKDQSKVKDEVFRIVKDIDPNRLSPMHAFEILVELSEKVKEES